MKKIFSYLVAVSTSCSFSFRKMEESGVFVGYNEPKHCLTFISTIDRMDEETFNTLYAGLNLQGSDTYYAYIYDKVSKYGLVQVRNLGSIGQQNIQFDAQSHKDAFHILRGNTYADINQAKDTFGILIRDQNLLQHPYLANFQDTAEGLLSLFSPRAFYIDVDKEPEAVMGVNHLIEKERGGDLLHESLYIRDFKFAKEYTSVSGIKITNTTQGVKLSKTLESGAAKVIDFQKSLEKHLEKQNPSGDNFAQPLVKLLKTLEFQERNNINLNHDSTENKETTIEGSLVKEFINKSHKLFSIEKQQELLKYSKILAIWHLVPSQETTQNNLDESAAKVVNRILIGVAIDKRNNTTFHWVTDLGTDIEVLFDDQYASIISENSN